MYVPIGVHHEAFLICLFPTLLKVYIQIIFMYTNTYIYCMFDTVADTTIEKKERKRKGEKNRRTTYPVLSYTCFYYPSTMYLSP